MYNVCLSARQKPELLKTAKEIKFEYKDRKAIIDYANKYPEATMILQHTSLDDKEINWKEIDNYNILCKNNFIFCTYSLDECKECKERNIKFYLGYPISSYYQLEGLVELGVCYARLDAPLFFDLKTVKDQYKIPLRAVPNVCYVDGIERPNGICGTWIRPENIDDYDEFIDVYEFEDCDLKKEQALYRIYMIQKKWPGEFNTLFTNFNHPGVNRMILEEPLLQRLSCQQKCKRGYSCRICEKLATLSNPQKIIDYYENI